MKVVKTVDLNVITAKMITNFIIVIIGQYIGISNHHILHLILNRFYVTNISLKLEINVVNNIKIKVKIYKNKIIIIVNKHTTYGVSDTIPSVSKNELIKKMSSSNLHISSTIILPVYR